MAIAHCPRQRIAASAAVALAAMVLTCAAPAESAASAVLSVEVAPVSVAAGQSVTFPVAVAIKPEYHAMANPAGQELLIPTTLTADSADFKLAVAYPAGSPLELAPGSGPISVYSGRVTLTATLTAAASAAVGTTRVPLVLRYQACSGSACLPPEDLAVSLPVEVLPAGAPPVPGSAAAGQGEAPPRSEFERAYARGAAWIVLVAYLVGLSLNLTPCVFPLLPVTMGFFAAQGEHRPGRTLPMAAAYVLSMAAVFTALGVAAALLGTQIGTALQSVYGRVAIAVILALLAASLFGAFEIRVPTGLLGRVQGKTGYAGAVITGATMGLVAAPCVGPFVSALIVFVADTGSVALGALLFFALAVGLGTPYLLLGMFTGLINKVPRGGGYLIWVRRALAMPILALIVHYVSFDLPAAVTAWLYVAVALGSAVYLGIVEGWSRQPWSRRFVVARAAVAILAAALAAATFTLRVMPAMGWSAPAREGLPWQTFRDGDLDRAKADNTPAVLYFTAEWCTYCRRMDAAVFRDAEVKAAARALRLLKVDLTHSDASGQAGELQKKYVHGGPPALVFFDRRGQPVATRGEVGKNEFLKLLEQIQR